MGSCCAVVPAAREVPRPSPPRYPTEEEHAWFPPVRLPRHLDAVSPSWRLSGAQKLFPVRFLGISDSFVSGLALFSSCTRA